MRWAALASARGRGWLAHNPKVSLDCVWTCSSGCRNAVIEGIASQRAHRPPGPSSQGERGVTYGLFAKPRMPPIARHGCNHPRLGPSLLLVRSTRTPGQRGTAPRPMAPCWMGCTCTGRHSAIQPPWEGLAPAEAARFEFAASWVRVACDADERRQGMDDCICGVGRLSTGGRDRVIEWWASARECRLREFSELRRGTSGSSASPRHCKSVRPPKPVLVLPTTSFAILVSIDAFVVLFPFLRSFYHHSTPCNSHILPQILPARRPTPPRITCRSIDPLWITMDGLTGRRGKERYGGLASVYYIVACHYAAATFRAPPRPKDRVSLVGHSPS